MPASMRSRGHIAAPAADRDRTPGFSKNVEIIRPSPASRPPLGPSLHEGSEPANRTGAIDPKYPAGIRVLQCSKDLL